MKCHVKGGEYDHPIRGPMMHAPPDKSTLEELTQHVSRAGDGIAEAKRAIEIAKHDVERAERRLQEHRKALSVAKKALAERLAEIDPDVGPRMPVPPHPSPEG